EDPENPRVLGKLKIPGYSDYLHPYDETHLIGVGKETVPAEEGDFSWYRGVKISLFDVSNVSSPREVSKVVIGDRGTDTPVLRDHKAFLFSRSKHLLVLPILLAEIDPEKYSGEVPPYAQGDYVFQGAYIFNITLDEGLVLRGRITHLENNTDLLKSGYYFSSPYSVKRALYIGNILYTISDRMVKMNSLEDLKEIGAVELP
ncbi:copper amine oxidase, partial [Candidatus Bathyarchaeota archaeon]